MHYKNNFLSEVIFKLDFKTPFTNIPDEKAASFSKLVERKFPVVVSKPITQFTVRTGPSITGIDQQLIGKLWEYRDEQNGDKILIFNPGFLVLSYNNRKYRNSEDFKADINLFYDSFQSLFSLDEFSRIGLRYKNEIDIPKGNPLEWKGYIKDRLIDCTIPKLDQGIKLTRSMHQLITKHSEDISVLFQYGIFNPGFPNPVAERQYILDIDCFISGTVERGEVLNQFSKINIAATEIFESSIEQELRNLMGIVG